MLDFASVIQFKRKTEPMGTSNSSIVSLAGAATSIITVATKYVFCRNKTCLLSRQKYAWRDKGFVATSILCRIKRPVLSRQTRICHGKSKLVVTKVLSRQNYVCHDKYLSRQKFSRQKYVRRDKGFVATKII